MVLALVVLGRGHAQEAWCGELLPEGWGVEVVLEKPDRAGALELLSTEPAQPYLVECSRSPCQCGEVE